MKLMSFLSVALVCLGCALHCSQAAVTPAQIEEYKCYRHIIANSTHFGKLMSTCKQNYVTVLRKLLNNLPFNLDSWVTMLRTMSELSACFLKEMENACADAKGNVVVLFKALQDDLCGNAGGDDPTKQAQAKLICGPNVTAIDVVITWSGKQCLHVDEANDEFRQCASVALCRGTLRKELDSRLGRETDRTAVLRQLSTASQIMTNITCTATNTASESCIAYRAIWRRCGGAMADMYGNSMRCQSRCCSSCCDRRDALVRTTHPELYDLLKTNFTAAALATTTLTPTTRTQKPTKPRSYTRPPRNLNSETDGSRVEPDTGSKPLNPTDGTERMHLIATGASQQSKSDLADRISAAPRSCLASPHSLLMMLGVAGALFTRLSHQFS